MTSSEPFPGVTFPGVPHTCSRETRLRVLRSVRWFAGLDDAQLERLNARISSFSWRAGQRLQSQGEPAGALHLIAAGVVKIARLSAEGAERIVEIAGPGDIVGFLPELGLEDYPDSAIALQDTCALRIDRTLFRELVTGSPSVALCVIDDLGSKLARTSSRLVASSDPVDVRVARILLHLMDTVGRRDEHGILIDVPLGRADIAQMAGSTEESVSRTMSGWRRAGLLESGRQWSRVLDPGALRELAGV